VLAVEGNRIRLSRKAILKEQRAKMGGGEAPPAPVAGIAPAVEGEPAMTGSLVIEGGGDFPDEPDAEPNFNRDGPPHVSAGGGGDRPRGGDRGGDRGRGGRPGGGGRGRGRGGRPGGGGGGGRHGGGGGGRH